MFTAPRGCSRRKLEAHVGGPNAALGGLRARGEVLHEEKAVLARRVVTAEASLERVAELVAKRLGLDRGTRWSGHDYQRTR